MRGASLGGDAGLLTPNTVDVEAARRRRSVCCSGPARPSAFIAGNSHSMIGLMQAIGSSDVAVPQAPAIVGFDDFEWADCSHPRLTVVAQPVPSIAGHAIAFLNRLLLEPDTKPETICLPPSLIVRDSCGTARADAAWADAASRVASVQMRSCQTSRTSMPADGRA